MHILAIALGGALGACLRAAVQNTLAKSLGPAFPHGIYAVNAAGSLLLGVATAAATPSGLASAWYTFIATGFCGSFTTFSSFAYGGTVLLLEGRRAALLLHIAANVGLSFAAALLGLALASPS